MGDNDFIDPFAALDNIDQKNDQNEKSKGPGKDETKTKQPIQTKPIQNKNKTHTKPEPKKKPITKKKSQKAKYSEEIRFMHKHFFNKTERRDTKAALAIVNLFIDEYQLQKYLK